MFTLAETFPGETVIVKKIICSGEGDLRIMEMGILPGTRIYVCSHGPMGDPIKIKVLRYSVAVRVADAEKIIVKRSMRTEGE